MRLTNSGLSMATGWPRRAVPGSVARAVPEWFAGADHVDVKSVETQLPLREFSAAMLGYQPAWVTALYALRSVFVRLLGMRQAGLPKAPRLSATTLPQVAGAKVGFFEVERADASRWCCQVDDVHLWAGLGVIEDTTAAVRQLHVVTVVRYKKLSGRLYFNVIRPFHHLVVGAMVRAGLVGST
jgi:hypothetical protein